MPMQISFAVMALELIPLLKKLDKILDSIMIITDDNGNHFCVSVAFGKEQPASFLIYFLKSWICHKGSLPNIVANNKNIS